MQYNNGDISFLYNVLLHLNTYVETDLIFSATEQPRAKVSVDLIR